MVNRDRPSGRPETGPEVASNDREEQEPGSAYLEAGLSLEQSNQTVTVDFCQEMTDKCTTDEQPNRKDCT